MSEANKQLPETVKKQAQVLLQTARQAQDTFAMYMHGCKDSMGLEGKWNLNINTWEFEPIVDKPEAEEAGS